MKRTDSPETETHMPPAPDADGEAVAPPPPPAEGGWLTVSEAAGQDRPAGEGGLFAPLRHGLGRLAASWRYLADPAERHALLQHARGGLSRLAQSVRGPAMTGRMAPAGPPPLLPAEMSEPDAVPEFDPQAALDRLRSALRQLPDKGEVVVPGNLQSLDRLLSDPPPGMDFEAADLLHDCFPRGTRHSGNRVLLAVARNLTRNFGRPGRLPMTSGKAWTMLDPAVFGDQMAAQLAEISDFVLTWQAQEKSFLILEFAEVELIEYLFEHLHPRRHGALLIRVMDFKVLSTRRAGLLRRIPARVRRFIQHTAGADPSVPLGYARDSATLLELIEKRIAFRPVTEAAAAARAEVEKIIARLSPAEPEAALRMAPPPAGRERPDKPGLDQIIQALGSSSAPQSPPSRPPERISATPSPPQPLQALSVAALPRPAPALPVPAAAPRKRFGNRQKTEAVMRVLGGESREQVAAALGATPALIERWVSAFLNGGSSALAAKAKPAGTRRTKAPVQPDAAAIDDLKTKLQSLLQTVEVLSTQIQSLPPAKEEQAAPPAALPPPSPPPPPPPPPPPVTPSAEPASPPPGFPAEDPNPPPRLKRSRAPRRR